MIKEWNLMRAVACLSIVFLHSTTLIARSVGHHPQLDLYRFFRIALCYATPSFIVLSIIILANRYQNKLPDNFWASRFKYIYLPFVSFAIIDALVVKYFDPGAKLDQRILDNILTGNYEGWFILVIFQLYFLHYFVIKFKPSLKWLFPVSLVFMAIYLQLINSDSITNSLLLQFRDTWKLPFLAWFGYFTIAFIIGKHYKIIAEKLLKYRWLTLLWFFISLSILYLSYKSGITDVNSRRLDLYPLVLSIIAVVLAWGQLIPKSKIINTISTYSFGIYLLHWQVQRVIAPYIADYFNNSIARITRLFFISLFISMILIKIVSHLPLGAFIVGNIKRKKKTKVTQEPVASAA
ncbi:acyltransferase family protein [Mesobacillus foraminis]|uniref:acyltransferase family protein n=1 Tax=Mesobacillus foraminis TaxID=279826 RepID=UPI0013CEB505|nr:acyltransferase family protein [Mesobacillus foraminis]